MNVNPATVPDYILKQRDCDFDPARVPLQDSNEDEPRPVNQLPSATSLSAIQKQFSALIHDLTRQLSALEKQLAQSLRELTAQPRDSADDAGASRARHPAFHSYGKIITDAARRHEVDPLLIGAVIRQESGFHADAVSKAGAQGLMQLMPDTARSFGVSDAKDPQQNVEGGTALLRQLLDRYNGQIDLALAAYNAGPAAVDKYGGIPPFPETQAYVRDIMESYRTSALAT